MPLSFNMSASPVLPPDLLSRLSLDCNFCESGGMLQRSFRLLDACFFMQSFIFLFICLIIMMSYYLIISNLLSFNVYLNQFCG